MNKKIDWQDVMIKFFGKDWVEARYSLVKVEKLAGRIAELEQENKNLNKGIQSLRKIYDISLSENRGLASKYSEVKKALETFCNNCNGDCSHCDLGKVER